MQLEECAVVSDVGVAGPASVALAGSNVGLRKQEDGLVLATETSRGN